MRVIFINLMILITIHLIGSDTAFAKKKKIKVRGAHGQALRAKLKYPRNFKHFNWTSLEAKKGGTLRLGISYPFDTLNPFILKGSSPGVLSTYVFETLTMRSLEEPFAQYGMLADEIFFGKDELSVTYHLRKNAKFSDGKPITSADVIFTFNKLISNEGHPTYKSYYLDVKNVVAVNKKTVKFNFKKKNPELHMILGEIPVLPKHFYKKGKFSKDFSDKALGSGPYLIKKSDSGKYLELVRNPKYWGRKIKVNKGRFNFDKIVLKVFRDQTIWLEGLKADEFDFAYINSSKQWAVDVNGQKWDKNWLIKKNIPHGRTQGLQGFVMNLRMPLFQNKNVRKAIALAFDFSWANKTLFYNQYTQQASYFDNSELGAHKKGLPSKEELELLNKWKGQIPDEVFTQELKPLGEGLDSRSRLRSAKMILDKDGWKLKDGVLEKNGMKLEFTLFLNGPSWQRIAEPYFKNLQRLGINAKVKVLDSSIYTKKLKGHNYEMIVGNFGQSESPGNEQRNYWSSKTADEEGSRNYIGLKNKAIDSLIGTIINAASRKELVTATRALDRILWFGYYSVPHWFIKSYRVTYWNKFKLPKKSPTFFSPMFYFMEYGWYDKEKANELKKAISKKRKL